MKAFRLLAIILPLAVAAGCGQRPGQDAAVAPEPAGDAVRPAVSGWMDVALPGGAPAVFTADESGAWALYASGVALRCDLTDGRWRSYDLGDAAAGVIDASSADGRLLILTGTALVSFEPGTDAMVVQLPEGFEPFSLGSNPAGAAILAADGRIGLVDGETVDVRVPAEPAAPASGLFPMEPDWAFASADGRLVRYDPALDLWQYEDLPAVGRLDIAGGTPYLGTGSEVLVRTAQSTWEHSFDGVLCGGGLAVAGNGVVRCSTPHEPLATVPSSVPGMLAVSGQGGPIWAIDGSGLLAWAELGTIETRLPAYDLERIECRLAGQAGTTGTPAPAGISPVLSAASGAFRIYESVSSRPDPFTEFPPRRRDLRRPLGEIAIEELRLVGITIDAAGGNQAMVEDASGVPYILYVDSELANNTRVAEITGNEVIVVQEVTVDYGPERGGVASIPTIYSMRLHEEGGL
jgi:hypothetical protein